MKRNNATNVLPGVILRAVLFSVLSLHVAASRAQGGFQLNAKNELTRCVAPGLALHAASLLVHVDAAPLWQRYSTTDRSQLSAFDRSAAYNWSLQAHDASNIALVGGMALSLGFCMLKQQQQDRWMPVMLASESVLITSGLTDLVKVLVQRPRPYVFNPDVPDAVRQQEEAYVSFWSGHTANTAALTFACANILQHSDVSKGTRTAAWIGAAVIPAAVGYLRVKAGRHFPTDVLTGYAVGALVGFTVPYFHRPEKDPFQ